MGSNDTAAVLSWRNAGILIMEDGLMFARAVNHGSWTRTAPAFSSFECAVLFSLVGIAVSAALLLASGPETVAGITAALAL